MRAAVLAVMCLALAACWAETGGDAECRIDRDCADGTVCTRVGTCEAPEDVYGLRIEWTVRGLTTDDPAACTGIAQLEVGVADPRSGLTHRVAPVPCAPGSFFYDKLPLGYTEVTVIAYSAGGSTLDVALASAVGQGGVVRVALLP